MRLTIISVDTTISIDGEPIDECDLSWVPEFVGDITGVSQKVHAVQWYDDHGEIELVTRDNNIPITELGIFEQAITIHAERKAAIQEAAAAATAAAEAAAAAAAGVTIDILDIYALLDELESEEAQNVGVATT